MDKDTVTQFQPTGTEAWTTPRETIGQSSVELEDKNHLLVVSRRWLWSQDFAVASGFHAACPYLGCNPDFPGAISFFGSKMSIPYLWHQRHLEAHGCEQRITAERIDFSLEKGAWSLFIQV